VNREVIYVPFLSSGFAHSGDVPRAARPVFFAPAGPL
jgi:hypothetical protein